MKAYLAVLFITTVLLSVTSDISANTESAGIIKTVSGEVLLVSKQSTVPATADMKIAQGNAIKTGPTGNVGLIFNDDTVASLGPNSELLIDRFQFSPVDHELSFVARLIQGTFCFLTGQIAKLAPDSIKFATPEATLGVRGTKFLVKID